MGENRLPRAPSIQTPPDAANAPDRVSEIAREVSDLFQQQMNALQKDSLEGLNTGKRNDYERRRQRIHKLTLELENGKTAAE